MAEREYNQLTQKRFEIRRRKEQREKRMRFFFSMVVTCCCALAIGFFCRRLLLERIDSDVFLAKQMTIETGLSADATPILEEAEIDEGAGTAVPLAADEITDLQLVYAIFVHGRGWKLPHRNNSFCMASAGEFSTALKIRVENQTAGMTGTIEYAVSLNGSGWQEWTDNGKVAGLTDTDLPLENFRARFNGDLGNYYDLYYSVLQDNTWGEWVKNGDDAGHSAVGAGIEGIRLSAIKKDESTVVFPGNVDPNRPMVALTYDDGPTRAVTPGILETLSRHGARATFFMVGNRVSDHYDVVRQMQLSGNEVGNHTFDHVNMESVDRAGYAAQLVNTNQAVVDACGVSPVLMRPCGGSISDAGMEIVGSIGMSAVLWNVDTKDWNTRDPEQTITAVVGQVKDGDIILMHDLYNATAIATETVVPELIKQGFQLVTVSELAAYRGGILPGGTYGAFRASQ